MQLRNKIRHWPYFSLFMKDKTKEIIIYGSIILAIILIRTFIITPIRVNGTSMDTTLQDKEIMILNKINYKFNNIERFDIVVIKKDDSYLIKRVIGLPGETLKYVDDKLYINDKQQTFCRSCESFILNFKAVKDCS